jgi:uncharacterized membrane protein
MSIGAQPPGRRGTVGLPYSALNLRLLLAMFGLVTSVVFAVLMFRMGLEVFGWILVGLAVIGAIDVVVVQLRRRARRKLGDTDHSLFE